MSLVLADRPNFRLVNLQQSFASLDKELQDIQQRYERLRDEHGGKCARSLRESMAGLLEVIEYVDKSDKALIYWVERGGTLKLALRCIGVDKRTQAITQRKTKVIKSKVEKVEGQFHHSSEVFMDGLRAVQDLNTNVSRYSLTTLGAAGQQATELCDDLDEDVKSVQHLLERSTLECKTIQEEVDSIPSQIDGLGSQRHNAQEASDSAAGTSAVGFGVGALATVGSFFFPPLAAVALAAGGLGVGSAITSGGYTSQVNRLRDRETELHSKLQELQLEIDILESSIPQLDQKRRSYTTAKMNAEILQARYCTLRKDSQMILDELLQARMVLSNIKMKTEAIAAELLSCGYAQTRREISGKLKDIVEGIQGAGKSKYLFSDQKGVGNAMGKLFLIEGRTNKVLMIMNRSG